jgi:nucleoside-diphosphate-sugar epimerase
MKNKLTVFGGHGFIGGRFCELFPNNVIKLDRTDMVTQSNDILYFISTIDNYNIHNNLSIDIETNLLTLMKMLDNIDKTKDVTVNFISSWFVYGKNNNIPFKEDESICNPTGFYSITKLAAEKMLICFCETFNIKYRIFRLANVLGIGDGKISKKKNALQYLIKEAVKNQNLPLYYGGQVLRDYIHVDDVCSAIKLCTDESNYNQVINIGSGTPYKLLDIIVSAKEYAKSTSNIVKINPTGFHNIVQVRNSYLDITKLLDIGFTHKFTISDTIRELVDFYKTKEGNNE